MKISQRSYNLQPQQQDNRIGKSPLRISKYKRLFSLQKIRINSKGLPNDFFRPLISSRQPFRTNRKNTSVKTLSVQTQEVRKTPHFQYSVLTQCYQPRQYKSEERKDTIEVKYQAVSEQTIKLQNQYTFSQSFFMQSQEARTEKDQNKYHNSEKKSQKKSVWEEQQGVSTPQKKQLNEIVSRKYLGKQKYSNWQFGRLVQPKPKNTLPILKARFPSAFTS